MFVLVFQKPSVWSKKNAGVSQRAVYMFVLVFQKPSGVRRMLELVRGLSICLSWYFRSPVSGVGRLQE